MPANMASQRQLVVFQHDDDEYALPIEQVQEILSRVRVRETGSPMPGVAGVISLRGEIISLIDFGVVMTKSPALTESRPKVIVCHTDTRRAGLAVQRVLEVLTLPTEAFDEAPETAAPFIAAVAQADERLILVLDPDHFIDDAQEARAA
jgi:purine-binding chemotaxis protein CheW